MKPGPKRTLTPKNIMKAIPGSFGLLDRIAKELGVSYNALQYALQKYDDDPMYHFVREAIARERGAIHASAEGTVVRSIKQTKDPAVALKASTWYLERTDERYAEKKQITVEGGVNPIRLANVVDVNVIPIDLRKQLLAVLDAKKEQDKMITVQAKDVTGKKGKVK